MFPFKVWVLTGDQEETALQVSHATGHIPRGTQLLRLVHGRSAEQVAFSIFSHKKTLSKITRSGGTCYKNFEEYADALGSENEDDDEMTGLFEVAPFHIVPFWARSLLTRGHNKAGCVGAKNIPKRSEKGKPVALVVDGSSLTYALSVRLSVIILTTFF